MLNFAKKLHETLNRKESDAFRFSFFYFSLMEKVIINKFPMDKPPKMRKSCWFPLTIARKFHCFAKKVIFVFSEMLNVAKKIAWNFNP